MPSASYPHPEAIVFGGFLTSKSLVVATPRPNGRGGFKRPRGRAPKGKTWDTLYGEWVEDEEPFGGNGGPFGGRCSGDEGVVEGKDEGEADGEDQGRARMGPMDELEAQILHGYREEGGERSDDESGMYINFEEEDEHQMMLFQQYADQQYGGEEHDEGSEGPR